MLVWHSLVPSIGCQGKRHLPLLYPHRPRVSLTAQRSCQRGRRVAHENTDTGPLFPVPSDPPFSHQRPLPRPLWPGSILALFALLSINLISSEASSFPGNACHHSPGTSPCT